MLGGVKPTHIFLQAGVGSGASTAGLAAELMTNPELDGMRNEIGLDENSVILCFSTEGDTDKENYKRILEG